MPPATKGLAPGVYVRDVKPLLRPYESASISNLAMISQATLHLNGMPPTKPIPVTSFDDFCQKCGADSLLVSRLMSEEIEWNWLDPYKAHQEARPAVKSDFVKRFLEDVKRAESQIKKRYQHALSVSFVPLLEDADVHFEPKAKSAAAATSATSTTPGGASGATSPTPAAAPAQAREWTDYVSARDQLDSKEDEYWEKKESERPLFIKSPITDYGNKYDALAKSLPAVEAFRFSLDVLFDQLGRVRKGNDIPGVRGKIIPKAIATLKGSLEAIDKKPSDPDNMAFLNQLGPIAVTAWSVLGFFQNGGKVLTLYDVPWDDVKEYVKDPTNLNDLAKPSVDAGLVCTPGQTNAEIWNAMRDYSGRRDLANSEGESFCFALLDAPNVTPSDLRAEKAPLPDMGEGFDAHSSACYYPWIVVGQTDQRKNIIMPPSAFVAGIVAGTDASIGPEQAPAGDDKVVKPALELSHFVNDTYAGFLNDRGVNCLRKFPNNRPVVFGCRTLSTDVNYRYIPVARLLLQIRKTIKSQTRWAVHKPNTDSLRKAIHRNLYTYLEGLRRSEALEGNAPDEAFRVTCDESNNPESSRKLGILNVRVEVAPVRPAEFIMVEVTQKVQMPS